LVIGVSIYLIYRTNSTHERKNEVAISSEKLRKDSAVKKVSNKEGTKRSLASIDSSRIRNLSTKNKKRSLYVNSFSNYKRKIVKGRKLRVGNRNGDIYKVENFIAMKKNDYKESYGKRIKFLNNYIVFEPTAEFKNSVIFKKTTDVVQFASTGDIGVLTGKINLQIEKNITVTDDFFKKHKVEVHSSVKAINFFYVAPDNGDDIYQIAQNLVSDENVIKAYVEILSNPVIPN
jgi:hypothetical protein